MFKRHRLIIVAFALTALSQCLAFGQSPENAKDDKADTERAESSDQSKSNQIVFPVRILENPPKTEADKRSEQEAKQREKEDLVAQQSVAESTEIILWLSGLQMILAVIGTIALVYSITLNRKATNAAVFAVNEARDANRISEANAKIDQRAWVILGEPIVTAYEVMEAPEMGPSLLIEYSLDVENVGKTPARSICIWPRIVHGDDITRVIEEREFVLKPERTGFALAPGEKRRQRLKVWLDFELTEEGGHNIRAGGIIAAGYAIQGDEARKITFRTFMLSQDQGLKERATMRTLDLLSLKNPSIALEFRTMNSDLT